MQKILLTSFTTWLPHQKSNSSDDLLLEIANSGPFSYSLTFLRHLPVDATKASDRTLAKINELQPNIIICCGMAESRSQLTVESNATFRDNRLKTPINLDRLLDGVVETGVSHNAGKFVCEGLYYSVLDHLQKHEMKIHGLFVHVPVINRNNAAKIVVDFELIMEKLACMT